MAIEKEPSCADETEPALLPVDVALERILSQINPVKGIEVVSVREALQRVVATDIQSPIDVPSYTNSAMDGYAINSRDLPQQGETALEVQGTAWAGRPYIGSVRRGQAVRIMTGGRLPEGTDTVVIQEHASRDGDRVIVDGETAAGRNVRHAGEDIKTGDIILQQGALMTPAHVGLLASIGIDRVSVYRRVRVAFFSTGDELRTLESHADTPLGDGEIFDSNRHTLFAMLNRLGVELIDAGVVGDTAHATRDVFERTSVAADLVVSSGGVSAGQADFVSSTLDEIGSTVGASQFFGLPGNPVAVMVTFYQFVQPAIKRLMGCSDTSVPRYRVRSEVQVRKVPGRVEYQRGITSVNAAGEITVRTTGKQGAGRLTSMCVANCLIVLPVECGGVEVGDLVTVEPFHGMM